MIVYFARAKVYLQRGTTYLNLVSQAMVLRLFLVSQGVTSWTAFGCLLTGAAGLLLVFMYLEDRAGVLEAETEFTWSRAPQLARIIAALDESDEKSENP